MIASKNKRLYMKTSKQFTRNALFHMVASQSIRSRPKCTFHYMLNVLIIPKSVVIRATLTIDQLASKSLHIYNIKKQFYISYD